MQKILAILAITLLLVACGGEGSDASNSGEAAASAEEANPQTKKSSSKSKDPKWVIAIEGLPELSGRIITASTMGGYGLYTLARSGFTSSISVTQDEPPPT